MPHGGGPGGEGSSGLDATPALVEIERERIPDGDFRVGDMEELPWDDGSFDLVTGFNSFFIAADMVSALAEARRVARPGASVAMSVFGRPERCQSTAMFKAVAALLTAKPSDEDKKAGPALHERARSRPWRRMPALHRRRVGTSSSSRATGTSRRCSAA